MQRTLQIHVFSTQSTVAKCCGGSFEVVSKRRGELYIAPFDIKRYLPEMSISFLYFLRSKNSSKLYHINVVLVTIPDMKAFLNSLVNAPNTV